MALDRSFNMGVDVFHDNPAYSDDPDSPNNLSQVDEDEHVISADNLKDVALSPSMDPSRITTVHQINSGNNNNENDGIMKTAEEGRYTDSPHTSPRKPGRRKNTTAAHLRLHQRTAAWRKNSVLRTACAQGATWAQGHSKLLCAILGALAVTVLAVWGWGGSSAVWQNDMDNNSDANDAADLEMQLEEEELLLETLGEITPQTLLTNFTTLQGQAFEWLLAEHLWQDHDAVVTVERFAVLVMDLHLRSLPKDDTETVGTDSTSGAKSSTKTVSLPQDSVAQAGVSVCFWQGVTCNDETGLVEAIVWANQELKGIIPNEVKGLTQLGKLDLGENQITGGLPDGLFDLKQLEYLYLHDNRLTGTLSPDFKKLKNLLQLYLGMNQFTGSLPIELSDLGRVRELRYLSLNKNQLSGELPQNSTFKKLYYLDLSYNQFSGSLPASWSDHPSRKMRLIRHMFLNNNEFSGSIPPAYPQMGNGRMESFHVGHNQLTGKVPDDYHPKNFIESLELHYNNFTEPLSPDLCGLAVFQPPASELVNLKADCDICDCDFFCDPGYCYNGDESPN